MRIASPGLRTSAPAEAEGLIKEARRRQRRRWLAAGAAMLIASCGAAAIIGVAGAGSHPRSPGWSGGVTGSPPLSALSGLPMGAGSGVRLLLDGRRPAWFSLATRQAKPINGLPWDRLGYVFTRVVGGWSAQPSTAGPACGASCPGPPVPNYFIADGSPRATRIAPGYEVAASDRGGVVWLITFQRSGADVTTAPAFAQEVTIAGRLLGPRYQLPTGYLFRRAVGGDLLLAPVVEVPQRTVTYKLWDPATRRVVRTFSDVIAASPEAIAWGPICLHCPVHVLSLPTRTTVAVQLPRGTWASDQGTFSSDGQYLAFPLWAGTAPDGEPALTRIAVIDLTSPRLLIVPGSALSWDVNRGVLSFGWQPTGHRLIAVLPDSSGKTMQVASWQPGQQRLEVATARIPAGTSAVLGEYG